MKKILFALLFTLPFLFAGCGDDSPNNTTGGGDITPPTEKNLMVSGVSQYYFIPIVDNTNTRRYRISFNIVNKTANDYKNMQIKPVFTDENDHVLTEADGLNYTFNFGTGETDSLKNSSIATNLYITYTGIQKMNVKFKVEVASDNMPTETFNFNTANFLTYLQAFLYTKNGTSESLYPITDETIVQANTTETSKIIFLNSFTSIRVMLKGNDSSSGEVILPENVLTLSNGTTFNPCSNETSTGTITAGTFFIGQGQACYLEIKSNSPDKWTYFPVKSSGSEVAPSGYKPTDAINIQVQ